MGTTRKGIVTLAALAGPRLICGAMLILGMAWFSPTGVTIGAASARGVASISSSQPADLALTAAPMDPPWT
jgi:hypothetical protein